MKTISMTQNNKRVMMRKHKNQNHSNKAFGIPDYTRILLNKEISSRQDRVQERSLREKYQFLTVSIRIPNLCSFLQIKKSS
jgi:hypothetical protein